MDEAVDVSVRSEISGRLFSGKPFFFLSQTAGRKNSCIIIIVRGLFSSVINGLTTFDVLAQGMHKCGLCKKSISKNDVGISQTKFPVSGSFYEKSLFRAYLFYAFLFFYRLKATKNFTIMPTSQSYFH